MMDNIPTTNPYVIGAINAAFSLIGIIFTAVLAYFTARINTKTDVTDLKVDNVKNVIQAATATTGNRLNDIAKVNHDIHTLVNSNMGIQLKLSMTLAERVAKLTKSKDDIAVAKEAKKVYEEHQKQQEIVDSKKQKL